MSERGRLDSELTSARTQEWETHISERLRIENHTSCTSPFTHLIRDSLPPVGAWPLHSQEECVPRRGWIERTAHWLLVLSSAGGRLGYQSGTVPFWRPLRFWNISQHTCGQHALTKSQPPPPSAPSRPRVSQSTKRRRGSEFPNATWRSLTAARSAACCVTVSPPRRSRSCSSLWRASHALDAYTGEE